MTHEKQSTVGAFQVLRFVGSRGSSGGPMNILQAVSRSACCRWTFYRGREDLKLCSSGSPLSPSSSSSAVAAAAKRVDEEGQRYTCGSLVASCTLKHFLCYHFTLVFNASRIRSHMFLLLPPPTPIAGATCRPINNCSKPNPLK